MSHGHDVDRFNSWATTYERHWMQRIIFAPIQSTVLDLAAEQVGAPGAILDVGCGTGRLLRTAQARFPGARLVGIDVATEMVKQAQAMDAAGTIQFQQATAEALPFPSGSFDLVFSTMTFHHWSDQARGAAEVARVLAPRGRWLLADFVAAGIMKPIRRLLRLHQFPEPLQMKGMLRDAGLAMAAGRRVARLGGQVTVMTIGRAS
jgi:ubiquinone/menaquinone biosynthesis C-methylase UbiE